MKKMTRTGLICFSFLACSASFAEPRNEQGYAATVAEKLGTGVTNVATGWVEIPKTMYVSSSQEGLASGLTLGFFKGIANTLGRALSGTMDIATFMIPTKPMVTPSLIWQNFDKETSYNQTWELYNTR